MLALLIGIVLGRCLLVLTWLAVAVTVGGTLIVYGLAADLLARCWGHIHGMSRR